jgi:hypothetical protein
MKRAIQSLLFLCFFSIIIPAQAATIVVDPNGGADVLDLEEALVLAVDGDIIEFVDGTHVFVPNISISFGLTFRSASGDPESCVLTANVDGTHLSFSGPSVSQVELQSMTFSEISIFVNDIPYSASQCNFSNAWVNCTNSGLPGILENCKLNESLFGFCGGQIVVTSCEFSNNSHLGSCFGYDTSLSDLIVSSCSFSVNSGIAATLSENYSVQIDSSSFTENDNGGFLRLIGNNVGSILIDSCLFADNSCPNFPAVRLESPAQIINSTFRNNHAEVLTAGVLVSGGLVTFDNVDFVENTLTVGPYSDAYGMGVCTLHLNCCAVNEANVGGDGVVEFTSDGCTVSSEMKNWGNIKAIYR